MSSQFRLLVTDLDNTLYDWVTYFTKSFFAMVEVAAHLLDTDIDSLCDDLKSVHQRHRNTEHPFALLETEAVKLKFPDMSRQDRASELDDAFHAFNKERKSHLQLYPGVASTLRTIRESGVSIVGHTEATVPNAIFRLRSLGIEEDISRLYAVAPSGEGHPDPERAAELRETRLPVRFLSQEERKPDPQVLQDICNDMGVQPEETLYVGDSITRDIGMANEAGVRSAWAKYGTEYDRRLWDKLVTVTHWTNEDVQRAEMARERHGRAEPSVVLNSFSELRGLLDEMYSPPDQRDTDSLGGDEKAGES